MGFYQTCPDDAPDSTQHTEARLARTGRPAPHKDTPSYCGRFPKMLFLCLDFLG